MKVSIDKCSGPECPCHMNLKPIRIIRSATIQSISINHGPPGPFPGAGSISIQMIDNTIDHQRRDRALAQMLYYDRKRR